MSQPCIGGFVLSEKLHMVVLRGYTPKPWLYVLVHGYTNLSSPYASTSYQRWLCVPYRGYTSHIVVMRGYTWLYTANVTKRSQNHVMTTKVVRPSSWRQQLVGNTPYGGFMWFYAPRHGYKFESVVIPIVLLQMWQHHTRKTQRWLCVPYRGYMSHIVVICGYTWLYTAYVSITFTRWLYVVIRSNLWLYAPVRGYTACCSPYASAAYHETPGVVMSPWSWLYVSYRCYAWFYVVIYCNYTSKRSQNHVVATRHMRHLHVKRGRYSLSITLWVL